MYVFFKIWTYSPEYQGLTHMIWVMLRIENEPREILEYYDSGGKQSNSQKCPLRVTKVNVKDRSFIRLSMVTIRTMVYASLITNTRYGHWWLRLTCLPYCGSINYCTLCFYWRKFLIYFFRFFTIYRKMKGDWLSLLTLIWSWMKMLCDLYEIWWQKICRTFLLWCIGWFSTKFRVVLYMFLYFDSGACRPSSTIKVFVLVMILIYISCSQF